MSDQNKSNYGMITEQGDLGLGFSVLNEQDSKNLQKEEKDKETDKK